MIIDQNTHLVKKGSQKLQIEVIIVMMHASITRTLGPCTNKKRLMGIMNTAYGQKQHGVLNKEYGVREETIRRIKSTRTAYGKQKYGVF